MARRSLQMLRHRVNPITTVIAEDESWMNCWDPQPKNATREWIQRGQPCLEKVPIERSVQKVMHVAFVDEQGLIFHEFVPNGHGIGGALYLQILGRFMDALHRRRPHLATRAGMRTWALLHDGAPAHRADPMHYFLQARGVQLLPQPGYSLDLNPMDYWFFNKLKLKMKGVRHRDIPALEQSVDAAIGAIPQADFAAALARLPECFRGCIAAEGRYFEHN